MAGVSLQIPEAYQFSVRTRLLQSLTPREREVLQLIAAGRSTKALADALGIKFKTAACHRQRVLEKAGAANTAELVLLAMQSGLIDVGGRDDLRSDVEMAPRFCVQRLAESRRLRERSHAAQLELRATLETVAECVRRLRRTIASTESSALA